MRNVILLILAAAASSPNAAAQSSARQIAPLLEGPLQPADAVGVELRRYLLGLVPILAEPADGDRWRREAGRMRERVLADFIYRGWPAEWLAAPAKMEDLGSIPSGKGYGMRKLRYQVVPGFYATAILYEPEEPRGRVPAILNTNGHVGTVGKAVEYKQKRCINQALMGMIALNLEWPGMGELSQPENSHAFLAHLDLAGSSGVGLFYLGVRKALDYLCEHPRVDRERLGMTGLSGGGFQTILLSALDERIRVAVPVAGFAAATSRIERSRDAGDIEHHPSDMLAVCDYPLLVALRAPRPTLLIYNAEDDCCYRAPLVKPYVFDQVVPYFALLGESRAFAWHMNTDPSTHNYQLDNRQQAYRFFANHFGLPFAGKETPVDAQIKSAEDLQVGLPERSLTILGVARKLAERIAHPPLPALAPARNSWARAEREKLRELLRYRPLELRHAWPLGNAHNKGLATISYRFDFDGGVSATGFWLKAVASPADAPAAILLSDEGKKTRALPVSERVNRGEQVLAADLVFFGDETPRDEGNHTYAQMLASLGDRALRLEVAQLIALARWLRQRSGKAVRLETHGMRTQVVGLVAKALEPALFSEAAHAGGIRSLRELLDKPVPYAAAPDLFCFGLLKEFDLDQLDEIGAVP